MNERKKKGKNDIKTTHTYIHQTKSFFIQFISSFVFIIQIFNLKKKKKSIFTNFSFNHQLHPKSINITIYQQKIEMKRKSLEYNYRNSFVTLLHYSTLNTKRMNVR